MTLLRTRGLTAGYGPVTVLHGLDLEVAEGEIVVILGANGAGKSTTMRAISGTIPRAGSVEFEGHAQVVIDSVIDCMSASWKLCPFRYR